MNRRLFLFILIVSSFVKAEEEMKWLNVGEYNLTEHGSYVFKYENNSVDLDLQLRSGDRVISTQSTIESRNSSEYSVIKNSVNNTVIQLQVFIRAKYSTSFRPSIDIEQLEVFTAEQLLYYEDMYAVSQMWFESSESQKEMAFKLLDETTIVVSDELKMERELKKSWMLMSLEKYDEAWQSLSSNSNLLFDSWSLRVKKAWLEALVLIMNGDFYSASEVLKSLLNEFDQVHSESLSWQLMLVEIQSNYGLSQALNSYYNKSSVIGSEDINQALNTASQLGDPVLIAKILYHLASYYSVQQQWQQAIATLEVALDYSINSHSQIERHLLYNQIGFAYKKLNNLNLALQNYRLALDLLNSSEGQAQTRASIHLNLALIYEILNDYDRAKRYFNQSKSIFKTLGNENFSAYIDNALGRIERENGLVSLAITYHKQSLDYFIEHSIKLLMESLLELSKDYLANEDFPLAEYTLLKVQAFDVLFSDENSTYRLNYSAQAFLDLLNSKNSNELQLMIDLGNSQQKREPSLLAWRTQIYLVSSYFHQFRWRSFKKTLEKLEEALEKDFTNKGSTKKLNKSMPVQDLLLFYTLKMNASMRYEQDKDFEVVANKALQLIVETQDNIEISEQALQWNEQASSIIKSYGKWLLKHNKYTRLFSVLEKYQAINLRSNKHKLQQLQIKEQSFALTQALNKYVNFERNKQLNNSKELQKNTDAAQEHYLALTAIEKNNQSSYIASELTLQQVQEKLRDDELLLRYFINDEASVVFAIHKKGYEVFPLPSYPEIQSIVHSSLLAIQSKGYTDLTSSGVLSSSLIPLKMINQQQFQKLVIIADDILNIFPFAAINISEKQGEYQALVSQVDSERTYSASDYFAQSKTIAQETPSISVFSNPLFLKNLSNIKTKKFEQGSKLWDFSPLPNTLKEAGFIHEAFPDVEFNLLAGKAATNEGFLSKRNREATIMHIATHGVFNDQNLNSSGLATSIVDEKDQWSAGFLSLNEMLFYSFKARLAVVSGCETTRGKAIKGEGSIGLTRGLLSQGVASVIGTIWSISDKATPQFMKLFYKQLKSNKGNASKALSASQRSFAESGRYRHPYYWAGFILTSSSRQISENIL